MNPDDPKFTAHALGEFDDLTPAERAEIEALLAADPAAAAEAQETQALAARLRAELPGEQAAGLEETQRAAVLAAAEEAAPMAKIVRFPWRRTVFATAAACVIVGAVIAVLFPAFVTDKEVARRSSAANPPPPSAPMLSAATPQIAQTEALASTGDGRVTVNGLTLSPSTEASRSAPEARQAPEVERVTPLLLEMDGFLQTGRFELARKRADQILALNPLSSSARELAEKLDQMIGDSRIAANNETPSSAPGQPDLVWKRPIRRFNLPAEMPAPSSAPVRGAVVLDRSEVGEIAPAAEPSSLASASAAPTSKRIDQATADKIAEFTAGWAKGGTSSFSRPRSTTSLDESGLLAGLKPGDAGGAPEAVVREKLEVAQPQPAPVDREAFDAITDNAFLTARDNPLSTFSIDVDTASYSIVRRFLNNNQRPPAGAVRIEELLNYFTYEYPQPQGGAPFSATMEVAACPWTPEHRLVRIGLKGREIAPDKRPASNLVFLLDVSGSMRPANKLPLLKQSLALLIDQLGDEDQVGIVVYAGSSGTVLEPTRDREKMHAALQRLEAGGSTNGATGLQLAYDLAQSHFIKGGTNRVILATDGDWNVGTTSQSELLDLIAEKAKSGVFLTVLGLGMGNLNDSMMVKLAGRGNGNYAYIDTLAEAKKVLVEQLSGTLVTIAKDVKIQVEFNPAQVGAYRLIGYEKRMLAKEDFNNDKKDAGEIGAGHTVTALYEVVPAGLERSRLAQVDPLKYQPAPNAPAPTQAPERTERPALPRSQRAPQDGAPELIPPHVPPSGAAPRVEPAPRDARPYLLEDKTKEAAPGAAQKTGDMSSELLTLKLRYKEPEGDTSKLLEFPLTDGGAAWERSTPDFRFAAAVAGYGMLLRDSPHKGAATWSSVEEWAREGQGRDASGYRAEFLTLIEKAKALTR